ncbi:MAG TPA: hypothetical protein VM536_14840 [Chloroflexia bacterium]|nr:hypothetical protein [Chloroflexia bacterium]
MVALCAQCGAPLTLADLGYDRCLSCHWQQVFEYAVHGPHTGELRLVLRPHGRSGGRDSGGRVWQHTTGDGQAWCTLCGATIRDGWAQGMAGGLQTHVCAAHVDIVPG